MSYSAKCLHITLNKSCITELSVEVCLIYNAISFVTMMGYPVIDSVLRGSMKSKRLGTPVICDSYPN